MLHRRRKARWGMGAVTAEFEPFPVSVRAARRFVVAALDGWDPDATDAAALLVSELATNATIHAGTIFRVTVTRTDEKVRVAVADGSPAAATRRHYSTNAATGRGIGMVADVADAWGVEQAADGKVVWFELSARTSSAPRSGRAETGRAKPAVDLDLDALLADLGGWDDPSDDGDTPRAHLLELVTP